MFATAQPKGMLSNWVDCIWIYDAAGQGRGQELALPTGTVEIVFDLSENGMPLSAAGKSGPEIFRELVVCGPHNRAFTLHNGSSDHVLGIHLKPAAAARFLLISASDLANQHVELEEFKRLGFRDIHEQLLSAKTANRLELAESLLSSSLVNRPLPDPAVEFVVKALGTATDVKHAIHQVGYSERTIRQRFQEQVGLTPKAFHRLMRFQNLLARVGSANVVNWGELASACGYYDQSHFIHDFHEFSGMRPTEYFQKRSEWLNHVSVD
jgi:AraC-like DNA-binding protein